MNLSFNKIKAFAKKIFLTDIVRKKDKEDFFENFSLMLSSGIDIVIALDLLKAESRSKGIKRIIGDIQADVKNGESISSAIRKAKMLPKHLMAVIEIGEKSGNLPENLKIVVEQIQRERQFKSKIRSASIYPMFVLLIMLAVGLVVAVFVLPRLTSVYKNLNVDLPDITQILINIGDWLESYGNVAIPLTLVIIITFLYFIFVFPKTKKIGQWVMLNTPVIRRLIMEVEVSRFGFLLGTLLKSGYPVIEALNLLENSTSYFRYKDFYYYLQYSISSGLSFKESIDYYKNSDKVLPVYARQLITSSEKTGKLADSLQNIGTVFEKRNEDTLKDITVLIEPLLLVVIWLAVAFVAFAVILPVYNLVGNISGTTSPEDDQQLVDLAQ